MTETTKIQIVESLLNADHTAMRALEEEQREIGMLIDSLGREMSVDLRLYERLVKINTAREYRLQSFEFRQLQLERLRGIEPMVAA